MNTLTTPKKLRPSARPRHRPQTSQHSAHHRLHPVVSICSFCEARRHSTECDHRRGATVSATFAYHMQRGVRWPSVIARAGTASRPRRAGGIWFAVQVATVNWETQLGEKVKEFVAAL